MHYYRNSNGTVRGVESKDDAFGVYLGSDEDFLRKELTEKLMLEYGRRARSIVATVNNTDYFSVAQLSDIMFLIQGVDGGIVEDGTANLTTVNLGVRVALTRAQLVSLAQSMTAQRNDLAITRTGKITSLSLLNKEQLESYDVAADW